MKLSERLLKCRLGPHSFISATPSCQLLLKKLYLFIEENVRIADIPAKYVNCVGSFISINVLGDWQVEYLNILKLKTICYETETELRHPSTKLFLLR